MGGKGPNGGAGERASERKKERLLGWFLFFFFASQPSHDEIIGRLPTVVVHDGAPAMGVCYILH